MEMRGDLSPEQQVDRRILWVALFVALTSGYFLFFDSSDYGDTPGAVPIGVLITDKSVRLRHAKSLKWVTIKESIPIYLKDMIYTPKDTSVEFMWGDKRFTLEPESLVQFDAALLDKLEITLLEGKMKIDPLWVRSVAVSKAPEPRVLFFSKRNLEYIGDINSLVLRHSELSARLLERLRKKLDFEPMRGVLLPQIYLDRLDDYRMVIKSPTPKQKNMAVNEWVELSWLPIPLSRISYELNVVKLYEEIPVSATKQLVTNSSYLLFDFPGKYNFKVVASLNGTSIESDSRDLDIDEESIPVPQSRVVSGIQEKSSNKLVGKKIFSVKGDGKKVKPKTAFDLFFGSENGKE